MHTCDKNAQSCYADHGGDMFLQGESGGGGRLRSAAFSCILECSPRDKQQDWSIRKNIQVESMFEEKSKDEAPTIKVDIATEKEGGVSGELPRQ